MAARKRNVRLSEIEWVVRNLALQGYMTRIARNVHQVIFTVDGVRFGVCTHHTGSSQLKSCYVNEFLRAMIELGLYEDE